MTAHYDAAADEEFVREFCAERGMSMDDPRLYQAAWFLAADRPNHPLVRWVRARSPTPRDPEANR